MTIEVNVTPGAAIDVEVDSQVTTVEVAPNVTTVEVAGPGIVVEVAPPPAIAVAVTPVAPINVEIVAGQTINGEALLAGAATYTDAAVVSATAGLVARDAEFEQMIATLNASQSYPTLSLTESVPSLDYRVFNDQIHRNTSGAPTTPGTIPLGVGDGTPADLQLLFDRIDGAAGYVLRNASAWFQWTFPTGPHSGKTDYLEWFLEDYDVAVVTTLAWTGAGSFPALWAAHQTAWLADKSQRTVFILDPNLAGDEIVMTTDWKPIAGNYVIDFRATPTMHFNPGGTPGRPGIGTRGKSIIIGGDNYTDFMVGGNLTAAFGTILSCLGYYGDWGGDAGDTSSWNNIAVHHWAHGGYWEFSRATNPDVDIATSGGATSDGTQDGLFDFGYMGGDGWTLSHIHFDTHWKAILVNTSADTNVGNVAPGSNAWWPPGMTIDDNDGRVPGINSPTRQSRMMLRITFHHCHMEKLAQRAPKLGGDFADILCDFHNNIVEDGGFYKDTSTTPDTHWFPEQPGWLDLPADGWVTSGVQVDNGTLSGMRALNNVFKARAKASSTGLTYLANNGGGFIINQGNLLQNGATAVASTPTFPYVIPWATVLEPVASVDATGRARAGPGGMNDAWTYIGPNTQKPTLEARIATVPQGLMRALDVDGPGVVATWDAITQKLRLTIGGSDLTQRTASYTLAAAAANPGHVEEINAVVPLLVTAPSATFTAGQEVRLVNTGTAPVYLAGSGVTIVQDPLFYAGIKAKGRAVLTFLTATTALLSGDLEPVAAFGTIRGKEATATSTSPHSTVLVVPPVAGDLIVIAKKRNSTATLTASNGFTRDGNPGDLTTWAMFFFSKVATGAEGAGALQFCTAAATTTTPHLRWTIAGPFAATPLDLDPDTETAQTNNQGGTGTITTAGTTAQADEVAVMADNSDDARTGIVYDAGWDPAGNQVQQSLGSIIGMVKRLTTAQQVSFNVDWAEAAIDHRWAVATYKKA